MMTVIMTAYHIGELQDRVVLYSVFCYYILLLSFSFPFDACIMDHYAQSASPFNTSRYLLFQYIYMQASKPLIYSPIAESVRKGGRIRAI